MRQEHIIQREILIRLPVPKSPNCQWHCTISCNVSIRILLYGSHHNFNFLRNASHVPKIFTTFFAVPTIRPHRVGKVISKVQFSYPPVTGWNISHASLYSCQFLSAVTDVKNRYGLLATASDLNLYCKEHGQGNSLEHSVFTDNTWIALYRVADYALSNYCHGRGLSNRDGLTESIRVDLILLARMSVQILRKSRR